MGQKDPFNIEGGSHHIEQCLLNLEALIAFGLHQIENSDPDEFKAMKSQWCTMTYMLQDQVKVVQEENGNIGLAARKQRASTEAHH